jgi:hypothetical protein
MPATFIGSPAPTIPMPCPSMFETELANWQPMTEFEIFRHANL